MNSLTRPSIKPIMPLCDAHGHLNPDAIGWSTAPALNCAISGHFGRRKRWNHWCINTPHWMLSFTQADLDYIGYAAVYFLDLESGHSFACSQYRLLARGCKLPDQPHEGHHFSHPQLQLRITPYTARTRITISAPDIGGQPLQVALNVQRPCHLESANLVAPLAAGCFHATSRQLGLPCTGTLALGDRQYNCPNGQSFASLDFGRGVWPLNSHWTRAAFAAPGGIAGNFGAGWTDHSGLSENALWFGGELQHLDMPVRISQAPESPLAPWQLSTADGSVQLDFTPRQRHRAYRRIGPIYADTQQWFGHFDGLLRGPDGERVPVSRALGWLGATHARW